MASALSHAVAALAIGACMPLSAAPKRTLMMGVACAVVPDLDVIGFHFGVKYGDFMGHRGFTHSILFAGLLATAALTVVSPRVIPPVSRFYLWVYFFLAGVSHGVLDAMTNGGLGVAFFAPFNNRRYFLPWRPIQVSPIGVGRFLSDRGLIVLKSEFIWIWLPAALLMLAAWALRRTAEPVKDQDAVV